MPMTDAEHVTAVRAKLAAKDPRYVRAWGAADAATTPPRDAKALYPCPHRAADPHRTTACKSCGGRVELKVYACHNGHGECTLGKKAAGVNGCCKTCPDRPAAASTVTHNPGRIPPSPRVAVPRPTGAVLPPFAERIRWVSTAQLAKDTAALAGAVPPDCSGVVGVPRSGMIPASLLATQLHVPLGEIDKGGGVRWLASGNRGGFGLTRRKGPVLVIDDTVYGGRAAGRVHTALAGAGIPYLFAAVYVRPGADARVDLYARPLPAPHLLEWNFANNGPFCGLSVDPSFGGGETGGIATDLDGILCHDDHSGGRPGTPYLLPRMFPCRLIITGRHERHRAATEAQLKAWGVGFERLEMLPDDVPLTTETAAAHKAKHYGPAGQQYFMESCPEQAAIIHRLTGKRVVCPIIDKVFHRD